MPEVCRVDEWFRGQRLRNGAGEIADRAEPEAPLADVFHRFAVPARARSIASTAPRRGTAYESSSLIVLSEDKRENEKPCDQHNQSDQERADIWHQSISWPSFVSCGSVTLAGRDGRWSQARKNASKVR